MSEHTGPKPGETVAYDTGHLGWRALAFYREGQLARVLILRNGEAVREFDYPAYRIWNIAAHLPDIVEEYEQNELDKTRGDEGGS